MEQNKTGKYLKYAIGEVVLVMIGILLALQVNNWNEERKDRKIATQSLVNLNVEFDKNQKRLESLMARKQEQEDYCRTYLNIITNDTISMEDKLKAKSPSGFDGIWGVTNAVLNSLLNTGTIDKINNDSLKNLLTNWPTKVERYKTYEERFSADMEIYKNYLNNKLYRPVVIKGNHKTDNPFNTWPGSYYPNNIESKLDSLKTTFINDMKYYNTIAMLADRIYIQLAVANEISQDYITISRLINLELKNRTK